MHLSRTLPSDTEINPKQLVMAINIVENKINDNLSVKAPTPVWVYIPYIPFSWAFKKLKGEKVRQLLLRVGVNSSRLLLRNK